MFLRVEFCENGRIFVKSGTALELKVSDIWGNFRPYEPSYAPKVPQEGDLCIGYGLGL